MVLNEMDKPMKEIENIMVDVEKELSQVYGIDLDEMKKSSR